MRHYGAHSWQEEADPLVLDATVLQDANAFRDANAARQEEGAAGARLPKFSTSESHGHQRNHHLCAASRIDVPLSILSPALQGLQIGGTAMNGRHLPIIVALGTTQTLAWASSVYLPAILADPIARDLGISSNWIFAAYSAALAVAAVLGPRVGRQIDRLGGRPVLSLSNLMLAAGLALLGLTHSIYVLVAAWLLLGIGMGYGLYDAAFGALGRIYGEAARGPITGITLIAGFASTVGWPLTALGLQTIGWRDTCFAWAAAHILIGLPINLAMLPAVRDAKSIAHNAVRPHIPINRTMALLAFIFASAWTVTGAMAAHLPRILEAAGATTLQAVSAAALVGPAQVVARVVDASVLKRYHPLLSTKLACLMHPLGAAIMALSGGAAAGVFAALHGAGNGVITISRGTLPLAIFGPKDYAYRLGLIGAAARMTQAAAPLVFGLLIDAMGSGILIVSSALSLAAFAALFLLPEKAPQP
jgi:MFS family permease